MKKEKKSESEWLCECGGNERVALDCTMKPCMHPKYYVVKHFKLPKYNKVMIQFDNDEPFQINTVPENGEFIINLKEGNNIEFYYNNKKMKLFIEKTKDNE